MPINDGISFGAISRNNKVVYLSNRTGSIIIVASISDDSI